MAKNKGKRKDPSRSFSNIREASDFWDTHSVSDIWDETSDVDFEIAVEKEPKYITLDRVLSKKIWKISNEKGVSPDRLVNSLLREMTAK
ncbi:MAG: CopG family antitoxin [bacterium]